MSVTTRFRNFFLLHLSKPASDRPLYQAIDRNPVRTILELGVGDGQRALRMIEVAGLHAPAAEISYSGVDLFEDRSAKDARGLSLKEAHRVLRASGAKIRLLPGNPLGALVPVVNSMPKVDLLVVSSGLDAAAMAQAWYFLPRTLHERSLVFAEVRDKSSGEIELRSLTLKQVNGLAERAARRRRAA